MSWNKIDNLLKGIEEFYKKALWSELVANAQHNDINNAKKETPEERADRETEEWLRKNDPGTKTRVEPLKEEVQKPAPITTTKEVEDAVGLYPKITYFSKGSKNEDVAEQLNFIADLYKEVIKNKKGYSSVSNAIVKFMETLPDYYSDYADEVDAEPGEENISPEQELKLEGQNIETLLNEVYADIQKRFAKQRDIEKGIKEPEGVAPESEEEQEDDNVGPAGLGTAVDPSEIGGKRPSEDGKTSSMSVTSIRDPKDWAKSYALEKDRCLDQLNDPAIDNRIKTGINEQVQILDNLIENTSDEAAMLSDAGISWIVIPKTDVSPRRRVPEDPDQRSKYETIKVEQKRLRSLNNTIKTKIRNFTIAHKISKLDEQIAQTRSPKEKFLLEQQKKLNELIASKDYNKAPEIKVRRQFIKAIEGGVTPKQYEFGNPETYLPTLNKEMVDRFAKELQEISTNPETKKIPFAVYDAKRKEDWSKQRQKLYQYHGKRRGKAFDLAGLLDQLDESLSSIKMGFKKNITAKLKEGKHTRHQVYIDAIAAAKESGDAVLEKKAIKALSVILNNEAESDSILIKITNYLKPFKDCFNKLKAVNVSEKNNSPSLINISELIIDVDNLFTLELNRSSKSKLGESLKEIKKRLEEGVSNIRVSPTEEPSEKVRVETVSPETGEVSYEEMAEEEAMNLPPSPMRKILRGHMNKKQRKIALAKLNKTALLDTSLDAKIDGIRGSLSGIQDPADYASAVYDAIIDDLTINKLDD